MGLLGTRTGAKGLAWKSFSHVPAYILEVSASSLGWDGFMMQREARLSVPYTRFLQNVATSMQ